MNAFAMLAAGIGWLDAECLAEIAIEGGGMLETPTVGEEDVTDQAGSAIYITGETVISHF